VGAYRHFVGEIPVWGRHRSPSNSPVVVDSLALNMRETTGETIDRPRILGPEQASRNIALQLETLMSQSKIDLDEAAKVDWARFGYLSLPGRKAQRVLALVYIASISITDQRVAQGYVLATPVTEKNDLSLALYGDEAPAKQGRNDGALPTIRRTKTFDRLAAFGQIS
jgi:hypothetical protein